jgi:thioesterase domain-containing protein/acyl carrier protein
MAAPTAEARPRARKARKSLSTVEQELQRIWSEVLGVEVQPEDNFFVLGGHSLLAVRLIADVQAQFGEAVTLASLWEGATIRDMARVIAKGAKHAGESPLVELRPGTGPAFYCVAPVGGNPYNYSALAANFGGPGAFYALRPPGISRPEERLPDVPAMARYYLERIREHQPRGPYLLGGFSYGGAVAFEMAQQLVAERRKVGLLAMLDDGPANWKHPQHHPRPEFARESLANVPFWLHSYVQRGRAGHLGSAAFELAVLRRHLRGIFDPRARRQQEEGTDSLWKLEDLPDEYRESLASQHDPVETYNGFLANQYRAVRHYELRPYPGRLTVFRSRAQNLLRLVDPTIGWQPFAPDLEVVVVPGCHTEVLLEPDVRALARELTKRAFGGER